MQRSETAAPELVDAGLLLHLSAARLGLEPARAGNMVTALNVCSFADLLHESAQTTGLQRAV